MKNIIYSFIIICLMSLSCDNVLSEPDEFQKQQFRQQVYVDELRYLIIIENGIEKYYSIQNAEAPDGATLILEVKQEGN